MPAPKPELARGEVAGCWAVVRLSTPDGHGRRRYLCKSTCCGRERVLRDDYVRRAKHVCVHCKGNGQAARQP